MVLSFPQSLMRAGADDDLGFNIVAYPAEFGVSARTKRYHDSLTFREMREDKKLDKPLPEVIKYDLYPVLARAPDLQAKLRLNETYSVVATCLLEFLTGRERN